MAQGDEPIDQLDRRGAGTQQRDPPLHLLEVAGNPTGQDRGRSLVRQPTATMGHQRPVEHRGGLLGGAIGDQRLSQGEVGTEGSAQPAPGERSFGERSPLDGLPAIDRHPSRHDQPLELRRPERSTVRAGGVLGQGADRPVQVPVVEAVDLGQRSRRGGPFDRPGVRRALEPSSALSAASLTRPAASSAPARLADTVATVDSCPIWWAAPMTRSRASIASLVAPVVLRQNAAAVIAVKSLVGST